MKAQASKATASGRMPPTIKTECQPCAGSKAELTSPPSTAPSGMPHISVATVVRACCLGAYSDASEIALGSAPPRPTPVNRRRTSS